MKLTLQHFPLSVTVSQAGQEVFLVSCLARRWIFVLSRLFLIFGDESDGVWIFNVPVSPWQKIRISDKKIRLLVFSGI